MKVNGIAASKTSSIVTNEYSRRDRVLGRRVDDYVPSSPIFNVTDYGAIGNGTADDTNAIAAALDAAGSAATSAVPTTLYFPTGTYRIMPQGVANMTVYQKAAGTWGAALVTDQQTAQEVVGASNSVWLKLSALTDEGSDGDIGIDLRGGVVYTKAAGTWSSDAKLLAHTGTGWTSEYEAPNDADGVNGDYYFRFYTVFDSKTEANEVAAIIVDQASHNYVQWLGDGASNSILSFYCWSDIDPMDYVVDTGAETITSASIPRNVDGSYRRGHGVYLYQDWVGDLPMKGIVFDGLRITGNTTANGKNGYLGNYNRLEEWDTSNQGVKLGLNDAGVGDIVLQNCEFDGFRGEILYRGGLSGGTTILIDNCTVHNTNGSSISIGAQLTIRNTSIYAVYNAIECYCQISGGVTEYVIVDTCDIDLSPNVAEGNFTGTNGVVHIGDAGSYLRVLDSTIEGAGTYGVYLAGKWEDVVIDGNTFIDNQRNILTDASNGFYGDALGEDLTVSNNTFRVVATDSNYVMGSFTTYDPTMGWTFDSNVIDEQNGYNFIDGFYYTQPKTPDTWLTVSNNTLNSMGAALSSGQMFNTATCPMIYGLGNTYDRVEVGNINTQLEPEVDNKITSVNAGTNDELTLTTDRYPTGHRVSFENAAPVKFYLPADSAWNTWLTQQDVDQYDEITIQFNGTKWDLISLDELKYAP